RSIAAPARKDVELLPVPLPAGLGFVDAAHEREPVAGRVLDDARLLVEDAVRVDWAPPLVARDRDFHLENAMRNQPGQELESVAGGLVRRGERCAGKLGLDDVVQFLTTLDRLHLGLVQ